ncbi:2-oxo-hept-3-ene-1,7-dioate hydratase [Sulfitobacter undariae]|uniref:2-oxo-hept-3-ene-1,7-dioate hydratase n=1 Tax=Sulfitobacter undariae TaxID=1563671 RepID=A0A7W6H0J4_9RHOB|nr:2-keto-4-pentenoate hydratase [Sulfitobacter undariae]MBB3994996.1 2-oxo-hept-3-ene-1,7-dioate hydratase [Sulfitobacter undariae]
MTPNDVTNAAAMLFEADQTGVQCGLISSAYPNATLEDAYRIQDALIDLHYAAGRSRIGWKIGLTSRAMQQALGITTPDSGVLLDNMLFQSGDTVTKNRFIQPRIEAEIAFVMGADIAGAGHSRADVIAATDHVAPCLEILDTRILRADPVTGNARIITDTISDNAANAGIVMGDTTHAPNACDLRWAGAIVSRNGVVEETGLGAGVLNDPVTGIIWLLDRLAQFGKGLEAGEIVLSGSFIRPIEAPCNSVFAADFGAFGRVDLTFE